MDQQTHLKVIAAAYALNAEVNNSLQKFLKAIEDLSPLNSGSPSPAAVAPANGQPDTGSADEAPAFAQLPWADRILAVLSNADSPLKAREISERIASRLGVQGKKTNNVVNTYCSKMKADGRIQFVPNHPGGTSGRFQIPNGQRIIPAGLAVNLNIAFEQEFRAWLPGAGVNSADTYIGRLRMLAVRSGVNIADHLRDHGLEQTLQLSNAQLLIDCVPGTVRDIRTVIRKYHSFLNVTTTRSGN